MPAYEKVNALPAAAECACANIHTPLLVRHQRSHARLSEWWQTSLICIASMLGIGVLGLPYTFSNLGWALGSLMLLLFAVGAQYSAWLLHLLILHSSNPRAYVDLGNVLYYCWSQLPDFSVSRPSCIWYTWCHHCCSGSIWLPVRDSDSDAVNSFNIIRADRSWVWWLCFAVWVRNDCGSVHVPLDPGNAFFTSQ